MSEIVNQLAHAIREAATTKRRCASAAAAQGFLRGPLRGETLDTALTAE